MPKGTTKWKDSDTSNPSGHVAKPPKGSKINDDTRVVHGEEPNRDEKSY
ncbi:MAG: hypothetical protein FWE28_05500 [Oscillospiraceae bacterium]|nr:hypothetical protein [Oscillospiraceae bacterium]